MTQYDPAKHDAALSAWKAAKDQLDLWKKVEANARAEIIKEFFPNPVNGANRVPLANGYNLKLQAKMTYSLERDIGKVTTIYNQIAAIGNAGPDHAKALIKFSADLSILAYNSLDVSFVNQKQIKALIDMILTIKEAAPSLEIEEPKKSK